MRINKIYFLLIFCILIGFVGIISFPNAALAGPGGLIAKAIVKSWWIRMLLTILVLIFLPLILYVLYAEKLGIEKTRKALNEIGKMNSAFRWLVLNERAHAMISHVYSAWSKADVEQAMEWMTSWYWQNQKLTVLDRWESEGLKNHCHLNKINHVKPLYLEYDEVEPGDGEGSRVVLLVEVNEQDYLVDQKTGEIVEGGEQNIDFETIWTLLLDDGKWKLALIEESNLSLAYAKMRNDIELATEHLKLGFKYVTISK